ncbi:unnamed protein product [Rhodiola kirilowii]
MALMLTPSSLSSSSSVSAVTQNPNFPSVLRPLKPLKVISFVGSKPYYSSAGVKARFEFPSKGGSSVLERPNFDQSQFESLTQAEEGGDIGRFKDKKFTGFGDSYRVLLVDDIHHTEKLVAKVLPQAVPSVTSDDAKKLFHKSRTNGVAVVIVTVKEHAEFYSQMMFRGGLKSAIEPDSDLV